MECSNHFSKALQKNPGFDFLNNASLDKESMVALQAALESLFVPFFDATTTSR